MIYISILAGLALAVSIINIFFTLDTEDKLNRFIARVNREKKSPPKIPLPFPKRNYRGDDRGIF